MAKIKIENDNWRLKLLNLKKILESLLDYYPEVLIKIIQFYLFTNCLFYFQVLQQSLTSFQMPNLNLYAESGDKEELSRLLQLVLFCAVKCDKKSEYIKIIMEMPEDAQEMIMAAIQDVI